MPAQRMEGQRELAGNSASRLRAPRATGCLALGVVRTLRLGGAKTRVAPKAAPVWSRRPYDERRLSEAAVLAIAWGSSALAPRALAEAGDETFDELSMVVGLLGWACVGM